MSRLFYTRLFFFFPENFSAFPPFEIQPVITLEGSVSYTFQREGINKVTVQVASGGTIMQDAKVITVKGEQRRRSPNQFNHRAPSMPPQSNG